MTTFLIVDGNSVGMRAAMAGARQPLTTREGIPTATIVFFFNMLNKIMLNIRPTHICIGWDTDSNTFRKKLYPEYKANRHNKPLPEGVDLTTIYKQFKFIRLLLDKLGIKSINIPIFEGDDICGSLARISEADMTYIVSGDRDSWSLVDDDINIIYPKNGFNDFDIIDYDYIEKKYGIDPQQFLSLKALQGDVADNIIGLVGCGTKTATKMINEFGSSDKIATLNAEDLKGYNKTIRNNLQDWKNRYELIKTLVTIKTDVELPYQFDDFLIELLPWQELKPLLFDLEMYNFINRIDYGAVYRLTY